MQGELGAAAAVTVCAKGGLLASVTEAPLGGNYFGCSQHLGKALNVDGRAYPICLGTNDVMQATKGFAMKTIEEGLTRIVLQLQRGVSAVFGHEPVERRGERVYVKAEPGDRIGWEAAEVVLYEHRLGDRPNWVGWSGVLAPGATVTVTRGGKELYGQQP